MWYFTVNMWFWLVRFSMSDCNMIRTHSILVCKAGLAKWLSVCFWTKSLLLGIPLHPLNFQMLRLFWAKTSLSYKSSKSSKTCMWHNKNTESRLGMFNLAICSFLPLKQIVFYALAWDLILCKNSFSVYIQLYQNITSKIIACDLPMILYDRKCSTVGIFVVYDALQSF